MSKTNLQCGIEQQRAVYDLLPLPLLLQLARCHTISVREFAAMFGISKSYAQMILHHKAMPPLDLAIRIARYFECSTDDLFGWRVDDDGMRRPLLVYVKESQTLVRLKSNIKSHRALEIMRQVAEAMRAKYQEPKDIHQGAL